MRRAALLILAALVLLCGVLVVRTLSLDSLQVPVEPIEVQFLDEGALLARLSSAITYRTVTTGVGVEAPDEFRGLHAFLRESFPRVHAALKVETINEWSLLFTWQGSDASLEPLLLMGHLDVVPVDADALGDWEQPPFAGALADGFLYGRGALDDKASVMAILEAAELLLAGDHQPERTVLLAFGHDEERGGEEGARAIRDLLSARGIDSFAMVLDEGGAVVEDLVPGVEGSVAVIGIAEKGSVTLTLTVEGAGGHSSAPPRRTNIGRLARAVARLEESPFPQRYGGVLEKMFEFLRPEMSFLPRVVFANTWLFEGLIERGLEAAPESLAMLHTTTAPTIIQAGFKNNVLPSEARAVVNFRILPGETPATVAARVRAVIDDPEVRVTGEEGGRDPSPVSDPYSGAFRLLGATIREVMGGDVRVAPYLVTAGTDARFFAERCSKVFRFLPILFEPGGMQRVHGTNERISTDGYLTCVRFFLRLIQSSGELP